MEVSGTVKQIVFGLINLQMFFAMGVGRSYDAFLFPQLDLSDSKIRLDDYQKTWITSSMALLTPFGCLVTGILMDVFGRKTCVQIMYIPLIVSWILMAFANSYSVLIIASLIQSISTGIGFSTLPYISEISTPKYRGALLSLVDVMVNSGALICNSLMYYLKWDIVSLIFAGISTVNLLLTNILPESPVWLFSKGKEERAIEVLCYLRSQPAHELEDEIKDMENSGSTSDQEFGFVTLKKSLKAWRQLAIACLTFMIIDLCGPVILLSYTVLLFERLRIPYNAKDLAMIYTIASFCGSVLTPFFVYNFRRKVVLGLAAAIMTTSMACITIYETLFLDRHEKPFPWVITIVIVVIALCTYIGIIPIGVTVGGELFPLEVRGVLQGAYGFITCLNWALVLKFYPLVLIDHGVIAMFGCFTAFCFLLFLYSILILPETKGKTLNQIQEQYFMRVKCTDEDDLN